MGLKKREIIKYLFGYSLGSLIFCRRSLYGSNGSETKNEHTYVKLIPGAQPAKAKCLKSHTAEDDKIETVFFRAFKKEKQCLLSCVSHSSPINRKVRA
jgi:hypothetical protein